MNTPVKSKALRTTEFENARVLIVDDNVDLLKLMSIRLKPLKLQIKTVTSAEQALSTIAVWPPDLVITDLQMPGMSGMELFDELHQHHPILPVIILTAHGTIPEAVEATQSGVASFLTKPFDSESLIKHMEVALHSSGFSASKSSEPNIASIDNQWRSRIITKSPTMENLLGQIEQLAASDCVIGFEGEPGTGKVELARAMHALSPRGDKQLAYFSCTSLPEDLIESEVFGVDADPVAGRSERVGLLRQAQGSSLIVADFNEAPPAFIRRLLNALVEKRATPVNSSQHYPIDVRAFTTNGALGGDDQDVQELRDFRDKLELTLLSVPPLSDHREDIPLIANHCLKTEFADLDLQISNRAMQALLSAEWPGNIRQLLSVVKQCARLSTTKMISDALVNSRLDSPIYRIRPLTNAHRAFERDYLTELLKVTNGNVTQAAALAKRNRTEIHRLLKKHKIEAKSFRQ